MLVPVITKVSLIIYFLQDLFQSVHPVHYLNSRCKGIGVSTNNNSATTTQSTVIRHGMMENGDVGTSDSSNNLFVGSLAEDDIIQMLLDHARDVSHWVSAEVVTCNSSKVG